MGLDLIKGSCGEIFSLRQFVFTWVPTLQGLRSTYPKFLADIKNPIVELFAQSCDFN